jgi:hypothetical protein
VRCEEYFERAPLEVIFHLTPHTSLLSVFAADTHS